MLSTEELPGAPAATDTDNVSLRCTQLVSVLGPNGTRHHVLFDPTRETTATVRAWRDSGEARGITVEDRVGTFTRDVRATVVDLVVSDHGAVIVTTDR